MGNKLSTSALARLPGVRSSSERSVSPPTPVPAVLLSLVCYPSYFSHAPVIKLRSLSLIATTQTGDQIDLSPIQGPDGLCNEPMDLDSLLNVPKQCTSLADVKFWVRCANAWMQGWYPTLCYRGEDQDGFARYLESMLDEFVEWKKDARGIWIPILDEKMTRRRWREYWQVLIEEDEARGRNTVPQEQGEEIEEGGSGEGSPV